jgi:hypothetical protein
MARAYTSQSPMSVISEPALSLSKGQRLVPQVRARFLGANLGITDVSGNPETAGTLTATPTKRQRSYAAVLRRPQISTQMHTLST